MKNLIYLTIFIIFIFSSCLTPRNEEKNDNQEVTETVTETPAEDTKTETEIEPETYIATEEEYEETFIEVDDFVIELNKIISKGNYNKWKTFLSQSYIDKYGSSEYLNELSENPALKNFNIKLKDLRDYFNNVVVPSRSSVKIDEIQFITEDKIKVYTIANNTRFVVYQLKREGSAWIITE